MNIEAVIKELCSGSDKTFTNGWNEIKVTADYEMVITDGNGNRIELMMAGFKEKEQ